MIGPLPSSSSNQYIVLSRRLMIAYHDVLPQVRKGLFSSST